MGIARDHGTAGEALAAAYFELTGCVVLARNVKLAGVEVDLVVEDAGTHVVVEVKTRTRSDYGGAALALGHAQRARLLRAARTLHDARRIRVDVLCIETSEQGATLRHYRNALCET